MAISQNFPDVRPSLNLNFARSKTLDPRITFTRASTGTYVGSDGLIKTAATDEARFDHDPETGESLGLLIEEQRTNYNSNSLPSSFADFERCTKTTGIIAPDGTSTAINYVNNGVYIDYIYKNFTLPVNGGTYYVISIFSTYNNTDITQGGLSSGSYSIITPTYHIPYENGWYRHWRVYQTIPNNASTTPQIVIDTSGPTSNQSLWGLQVETGSFPTSYIPTSGSTVTRNADLAYITQANMQSWYNNTEGTIFSHSIGFRGEGGIAYFGSNTEGWGLFQNPSYLTNKGRGSYTPDTANDNTILYNTYENVKAGISINDTTNLSNYAVNGVIRGDSQTRSGPFTYPTGFGLAQADVTSTNQVRHSLCLNRIVYYPVALSASQIQTLTK